MPQIWIFTNEVLILTTSFWKKEKNIDWKCPSDNTIII